MPAGFQSSSQVSHNRSRGARTLECRSNNTHRPPGYPQLCQLTATERSPDRVSGHPAAQRHHNHKAFGTCCCIAAAAALLPPSSYCCCFCFRHTRRLLTQQSPLPPPLTPTISPLYATFLGAPPAPPAAPPAASPLGRGPPNRLGGSRSLRFLRLRTRTTLEWIAAETQ